MATSNYHKRKALGLCPDCGKPNKDNDCVRCRPCSARINKNTLKRRIKLHKNGLCRICGKQPTQNFWCNDCALKRSNIIITLKKKVVDHYGGKCVQCGMAKLQCLELDHINNDGAKHRKSIGLNNTRGGSSFYRWIIKNNYPDLLQVLCANCHAIKHCRWDEYLAKYAS